MQLIWSFLTKGRSLWVFLRSGMHFLAVGSNIRIVALCASLGNAKDLWEWRDWIGKTAADLKLLDKGEIIVSISYKWDTQVILKPDKTTDWRNTDHCHCFLVSWIWKGTCLGNQGFSDDESLPLILQVHQSEHKEVDSLMLKVFPNSNI